MPAKAMTEQQDAIRAKHPFVVDFEQERFDAYTMENIRIEGVLIGVKKGECAKCGGKRHQLDTTGFCKLCKVEVGLRPASSVKPRSGAAQDRDWEQKRGLIASSGLKPGEIAVDEVFLLETRRLISSARLQVAVEKVWSSLGPAVQLKIIQAAFEQMSLDLAQPTANGQRPTTDD